MIHNIPLQCWCERIFAPRRIVVMYEAAARSGRCACHPQRRKAGGGRRGRSVVGTTSPWRCYAIASNIARLLAHPCCTTFARPRARGDFAPSSPSAPRTGRRSATRREKRTRSRHLLTTRILRNTTRTPAAPSSLIFLGKGRQKGRTGGEARWVPPRTALRGVQTERATKRSSPVPHAGTRTEQGPRVRCLRLAGRLSGQAVLVLTVLVLTE